MFRSAMFSSLALSLGLCLASTVATAQTPVPAQPPLAFPAPSPASTLKQRVGTTDIEIVYSRPSLKGRQIMGTKVPYGEVWRTGANAATTISFSTAVKLNGQDIPAGTYALYTIPAQNEWTVIIFKDPKGFGAFGYDPKGDLARFKAKPVKLNEPVETFTIDINDLRDDSATINLSWEKVRVPVKLQLDLVGPMKEKIKAAMAGTGAKPYNQAAAFYLEHNIDLPQALKWVEASIAEKAAPNNTHLKAKILAKMGRKDEALAAAKQSLEIAKQTSGGMGTEYSTLNQQFIQSLGGGK